MGDFLYLGDASSEVKEEKEHLLLWEQGERDRLIQGCLRLAFTMAKSHLYRARKVWHGFDLDELVGVANLALVESIDTWNPQQGPLKPYLVSKLKRALRQAIRHSAFIYIPTVSVWQNIKKIMTLEDAYGRLTVDELTGFLMKSKREVLFALAARNIVEVNRCGTAVRQLIKSTESGYLPLADGITPCLADVESVIDHAIRDDLRRNLFIRRFGLCGHRVHTKTELAKEFETTSDCVEYAAVAGIKELRQWFDPNFFKVKTCKVCMKEFEPVYQYQKYCSTECNVAEQARRKKIIQKPKKCEWEGCGRIFTPKRKSTKFCSPSCAIADSHHKAKLRKQSESKATVICEDCEKEFIPKRSGESNRYGKRCPVCYKEYRKRWHAANKKRKYRLSHGLCVECGRPVVVGREVCKDHLPKGNNITPDKPPPSVKVYRFEFDRFRYEPPEIEVEMPEPTDARPGSQEKMEILRQRLEQGLPIFHPEDTTLENMQDIDFAAVMVLQEMDDEEFAPEYEEDSNLVLS